MHITGTGTGLHPLFCLGQGKKRAGSNDGEGTDCTGGYERVQTVQPGSVAGRGVMKFGMSHRIKPKEKYVRISKKEIWCNLGSPPKNKQLWSYVVSFNLVG